MMDRRTILIMLSVSAAAACSAPGRDDPNLLIVYRSPHCECCAVWGRHVRSAGFKVKEVLATTPDHLKVPEAVRSCHTSEISGYFIEGHVPPADIRRLLREQPVALGLAVPGMPVGSPGMEQGEQREPYDTLLVKREGSTTIFARHNQSPSRDGQTEGTRIS